MNFYQEPFFFFFGPLTQILCVLVLIILYSTQLLTTVLL